MIEMDHSARAMYKIMPGGLGRAGRALLFLLALSPPVVVSNAVFDLLTSFLNPSQSYLSVTHSCTATLTPYEWLPLHMLHAGEHGQIGTSTDIPDGSSVCA